MQLPTVFIVINSLAEILYYFLHCVKFCVSLSRKALDFARSCSYCVWRSATVLEMVISTTVETALPRKRIKFCSCHCSRSSWSVLASVRRSSEFGRHSLQRGKDRSYIVPGQYIGHQMCFIVVLSFHAVQYSPKG